MTVGACGIRRPTVHVELEAGPCTLKSMTLLSASAVLGVCTQHGINPNAVIFSDEQVALPRFDWVAQVFGPAWTETKRRLQIERYTSESNDCDDYARMCAGYAQMLHNLTLTELREAKKPAPQTGLAFGEFWYTPPSGAHAINAFIHLAVPDVQDIFTLSFLEPQTSQIVRLTRHEIKSCSLFRL